MEHLGNTKLSKTSVYKGLLLDYGIIWNSMKYECGGGGGNRTRVLLSFHLGYKYLILLTIIRQPKTLMGQV